MKRLLIASALLTLTASAHAADRWFHIRVQEDEGARVSINLPFTVLSSSLPLVPVDEMQEGRLRISHCDLNADHLREVWRQLTAAAPGTTVTVNSDDGVTATRVGGKVLLVSDDGTQVHIDEQMVAALVSGSGPLLNVRAALNVLASGRAGELAVVTADDTHVRIWIDEIQAPSDPGSSR